MKRDFRHSKAIEVVGARTHNLKGVDCRVPHGAVTVVTGPSGAGKSSLAFDTIYAEGQRRFVESMSTYARQFLERMERPPLESLDNILPAVALEARNSIKNARSTVGTITEALDVLRLLFAHLGEVRCENGHGAMERYPAVAAADLLATGVAGDRFLVVVDLAKPKAAKSKKSKKSSKSSKSTNSSESPSSSPSRADGVLDELVRQGYSRRLVGDEIERLELGGGWPRGAASILLVLGRFRAGEDAGRRLVEAVEEAYALGLGRALAIEAKVTEGSAPRRLHLAAELVCTTCGETARTPTPALFSFNSPLGACARCQGFGRVIGIDPERVVPDPTKSLEEGALVPWTTPAYEKFQRRLEKAARVAGVPLDVPWQELAVEHRRWVWSGKGTRAAPFTSLNSWFKALERKIYKVHVRVLLARYRSYNTCPDCKGRRLKPEALRVQLIDRDIAAWCALSIEEIHRWLMEIPWTELQRRRAGHLLEELAERVAVLHRVGLDYLTLDRQARTLSGGETQRIHLAASLGSGLTSTLYVLDEPTIGLHPQDSERLLNLLRQLADRGNTVLVVEHDPTIIRGADHLIDLGPMAGSGGGEVMAAGTVEEVLADERSLTARFLRQKPATQAGEHLARFHREHGVDLPSPLTEDAPRVLIRGARENNLRGFDLEVPLGAMVAITGVSGSGKSTLVENVLFGNYQRAKGAVDVEPGDCDGLEGLDDLEDLTLVDQRPLGRSSRSNPVTYVKAWDDVRKLFAATPRAQRDGIEAGHFSFNIDKGRCQTCTGTGIVEVDMQFMASVTVTCDTCNGRRFRPAVLAVTLDGLAIDEVLELTIDATIERFSKLKGTRGLVQKLGVLRRVGLGYLRLGQPTATLSGGEAQRLKLAAFLDRPKRDFSERLFLFDEPTTGLHLADIDLLYDTLRNLVDRGDSVWVVEHSTDLIARCDWIVELGPGGGKHGGELLYSGPILPFLERIESPTSDALREHFRWPRRGKVPGLPI